jgi:hypothetical protein
VFTENGVRAVSLVRVGSRLFHLVQENLNSEELDRFGDYGTLQGTKELYYTLVRHSHGNVPPEKSNVTSQSAIELSTLWVVDSRT